MNIYKNSWAGKSMSSIQLEVKKMVLIFLTVSSIKTFSIIKLHKKQNGTSHETWGDIGNKGDKGMISLVYQKLL